MAKKVTIIEVGLRDGLQNESSILTTSTRLTIAKRLVAAGLKRIEIGSYVSEKWVPQMADSHLLIKKALKIETSNDEVRFAALVPNMHGMNRAVESGIREIAVFAAVSDSFSQKNINCTFDESVERFLPVIAEAKRRKIKVRGYLSTVFGCPYEGEVDPARVVRCAKKLMSLGVYELSIGDTIGVANPKQVRSLIPKLEKHIPKKKMALHMHDTQGMALANILAALDLGISNFDSSIGGLGGCPYAPGASGNVATEDVVNMLESMGCDTGLDLKKLIALNRWIEPKIDHALPAKMGRAGYARRR